MKRTLQRWQRSQREKYNALLVTACAGTWSPQRKADTFGTDNKCQCGERGDDFHRIWGQCKARSKDIEAELRKSDHLKDKAARGKETVPALWLRGLTPKVMTTPPICRTTADTERAIGEAAMQGGRLKAEGDQPLVLYTDGSGGQFGHDPRYSRCGWAWARLEAQGATKIKEGWADVRFRVSDSHFGPLPGTRQTNNRAELWAFKSALTHTEGNLIVWTDSEILIKGWRAMQEGKKPKKNLDIWQEIEKEAKQRGTGKVTLQHIESHISAEEAKAKGYPAHAWFGNKAADTLAGEAAETEGHRIDPGEITLYEWVRATSNLIAQRIATTTKEALERNAKDKEKKETLTTAEFKQATKKREITEMISQTKHSIKEDKGRWRCTKCGESIQRKGGDKEMRKHWLQGDCKARGQMQECKDRQAMDAKVGLRVCDRLAHTSHNLVFSAAQAKWFCRACGATCVEQGGYISSKLGAECQGKPTNPSAAHVLNRMVQSLPRPDRAGISR